MLLLFARHRTELSAGVKLALVQLDFCRCPGAAGHGHVSVDWVKILGLARCHAQLYILELSWMFSLFHEGVEYINLMFL